MKKRYIIPLVCVLVSINGCRSAEEKAAYEAFKQEYEEFKEYKQEKLKDNRDTPPTTTRSRPKAVKEIPLYTKLGFSSQKEYEEGLANVLQNGMPGLNVYTYQDYLWANYGVRISREQIPVNNCYVPVDDRPQYDVVDGKCTAVYYEGSEDNGVTDSASPSYDENSGDEITENVNYQGSFGEYKELSEPECFGTDSDGFYLTWIGQCVIMTPDDEVLN